MKTISAKDTKNAFGSFLNSAKGTRVRNDVVEILFIFNSAQNIKNILTAIENPLT